MNAHIRIVMPGRRPLQAGLGIVLSVMLAACGGNALSARSAASDSPAPRTSGATVATSPPPGLPNDWSRLAIRAATSALQTCAQADTLNPANCPQEGSSTAGEALGVHWTLLNQPLDQATAELVPTSAGTSSGAQVAVFGLYQMDASFTTPGQSLRPYLEYRGGRAVATMTWDGSSFQNVAFTPGGLFSDLPPVTLPPFSRPVEVSDAAVLAAVRSGFHDCVTLKITTTSTTPPNCPNGAQPLDAYFVNPHWVLDGDPMQGALVTFDTEHGNFAVTGSVSMTLHAVRRAPGQADDPRTFPSPGNYLATLSWNGQQLTLLNIGGA